MPESTELHTTDETMTTDETLTPGCGSNVHTYTFARGSTVTVRYGGDGACPTRDDERYGIIQLRRRGDDTSQTTAMVYFEGARGSEFTSTDGGGTVEGTPSGTGEICTFPMPPEPGQAYEWRGSLSKDPPVGVQVLVQTKRLTLAGQGG